MGFFRQEYQSGLPCPSPGELPNPGTKARSPTLQADSLPSEPPGKPTSGVVWQESKEKQKRHPGVIQTYMYIYGLPWWLNDIESTCQYRRQGSIPWSGRSPGDGNGNPLQYSCLKNPRNRGASWFTVQRVSASDATERMSTQLTWLPTWLPRWLSHKEFICNAGDLGLIPGSGRSPGGRNGNPFQYS